MCEELDKCYGTDGTFASVTYKSSEGKSKVIPEYEAYHGAKSRCNNPAKNVFHHYGGRGIEFRFTSFSEWWALLGRKPTPNHSVDRIDGEGHYEAGNLRWATAVEQNVNKANVKAILVAYGEEPYTEFESFNAADRALEGICSWSLRQLCHGRAEVVNGYHAKFAPQLTKE
jgi:hypothetical protein